MSTETEVRIRIDSFEGHPDDAAPAGVEVTLCASELHADDAHDAAEARAA